MNNLAEDAYYVTRDGHAAYGLNQLLAVPADLTEVELTVIDVVARRAVTAMSRRHSATPCEPVRLRPDDTTADNALGAEHGLFYVGPDGRVWALSQPDTRPALEGTDLDFAVATVEAGRANLARLRLNQRNGDGR